MKRSINYLEHPDTFGVLLWRTSENSIISLDYLDLVPGGDSVPAWQNPALIIDRAQNVGTLIGGVFS